MSIRVIKSALGALLLCCVASCTRGGASPTQLPLSEAPSDGTFPALRSGSVLGDDGFVSEEFAWFDAQRLARRADMAHNDERDPMGSFGGLMHRFVFMSDMQTLRTCIGSTADHPGFGAVVSHLDGTGDAVDSLRTSNGTYQTTFSGAHHAIFQYVWEMDYGGAPVHVTVQWFFATGRDNPIFAVTFDSSKAAQNAVNADSRAPYGDIAWDGDGLAAVDGVSWGDHFIFESLDAPISLASGWDYSKPNTVPFVRTFSRGADAEMGSVQTQDYTQHDAGGSATLFVNWGKTVAQGPMPDPTAWPYQIDQYELNADPQSKRLAWGTNVGAVGQTRYQSFGDGRTLSGYPYQSYSTFVVIGRSSAASVATQVAATQATLRSHLTADKNCSVLQSGPGGVGRTDLVTYSPPGYNPIFATWALQRQLAGTALRFYLESPSGAATAPIFEIHGWGAALPKSVQVGTQQLVADKDYFASVEPRDGTLFLTLRQTPASLDAITLD